MKVDDVCRPNFIYTGPRSLHDFISSTVHICNKLCILWLSSPFKWIGILGSSAIKCVLCYPSLRWCGKDVNFRMFDSVEK